MRGYLIVVLFVMSLNYINGQSEFPYQQPDNDVLTLVDAQSAPAVRIKHDISKAVLLHRNTCKRIKGLNAREFKIEGIRWNQLTNDQSRTLYNRDMKVLDGDFAKGERLYYSRIHTSYVMGIGSVDR